ncbi:MAG: type II toxin-antitoxin system VapC family toxin [Rhodopila sp.]|nr:type II toxin-antitoxin system VapC family toxin [Rhodopila sp.]
MIVDSSALLAMILNEPDEPRVAAAMVDAPALRMSVANWVEAAMVVDSRKNPRAKARFEDLIQELGMELVPVTVEAAYRSRSAHADYGRGNHPAKLNYGDCFAYALAKLSGEPLLFIGDDFAQTDVEPALKD